MSVAASLKFVRGAVGSKNSSVTEMTHYSIKDGTVRSFNGVLTICSPIDFPVDCQPKASMFGTALTRCTGDTMSLEMTASGRLRVHSDDFTAFVDCIDTELPHLMPAGEAIEFDGKILLMAMRKLRPFIGIDASRIWTNGILFKGESAFATNNVCLIEHWLGARMPRPFNVPMMAIKELIRIGEPPVYAQADERSMTFHFSGERWLRTQLYTTEWPDLSKLMPTDPSNCNPVPSSLYEGLEAIGPFLEKTQWVHIREGAVHTATEAGLGASYNVGGLQGASIFSAPMLALLETVADIADFTKYPEAVPFFGEGVRGVLMGIRG